MINASFSLLDECNEDDKEFSQNLVTGYQKGEVIVGSDYIVNVRKGWVKAN